MWTCPKCERRFKTTNQSHSCVPQDLGRLFLDRPDELVLAFDTLMREVLVWEPNSLGATQNAIVFTNRKAWLIVRPMRKELDVKIYQDEELDHGRIKKIHEYRGVYGHHFRIREEEEVDRELLELLRLGFDYAMR